MAKFISKLDVELINQQDAQGRGTWKIKSTLLYQSDIIKGQISVPVDFVTDFASVPRIPIFFDLFGDIASEAAVVHDYLYKTGIYSRKISDKILKEAAIATGCPNWQALGLYIGVRLFGWIFYKG
jgi:hypothetical protein